MELRFQGAIYKSAPFAGKRRMSSVMGETMQNTALKKVWGAFAALAACAAIIALALSLAPTQTIYANDLTAGEADLTTQASDATVWPIQMYLQHGTDPAVLVKSYTKDEFAKLAASSANPISDLSWDGSSWSVTTAVKYVNLYSLLVDAGIHWDSGTTLTYEKPRPQRADRCRTRTPRP